MLKRREGWFGGLTREGFCDIIKKPESGGYKMIVSRAIKSHKAW